MSLTMNHPGGRHQAKKVKPKFRKQSESEKVRYKGHLDAILEAIETSRRALSDYVVQSPEKHIFSKMRCVIALSSIFVAFYIC